MTILEIRAPAEQEGTRSQVLRWLKAAGEAVRENEPVVELETDKVTVEVAAPASGVIREILKNENEELTPGEVLARMEAGAESSLAIKGVMRPAEAPKQFVAAGSATATSQSTQLSPAVRRLLSERGLDASAVHGSGPGNRITIDDVLSHTPREAVNAPPPPAAVTGSGNRLVPHSPIRMRVAEHMVQSLLRTAPHVTTVFEADMGAVIAHRARHKADLEKRGSSLTFTAYFLSAAAVAIRAVPQVNSRWTDQALEIFDNVDIGVATALEDGGLIVPVLRGVESRDVFDLAAGLHALIVKAREGKLQPADLRGGTFTISNHGVSGSLIATPIVINQPQSAILGVGKLEKRAVVDAQDRVVVRPRCYVTLTIDHRVMDGQEANRFLQAFVTALETSFD